MYTFTEKNLNKRTICTKDNETGLLYTHFVRTSCVLNNVRFRDFLKVSNCHNAADGSEALDILSNYSK